MPASRIFAFADPYAYQASVRAADVELFLPERGEFRGSLMQIDLHRLWMQRGSESLPGISHSATPNGRAAIEFLTGANQPPYQYNGIHVRPGEIVINDLHLGHRRWSTPHSWRAMSLTPTDLAEVGRALLGRELTVPPVGRVVRPTPDLMKRLLSLHVEATRLARPAPDMLRHPEVARALEQALIHVMIRCWSARASIELRVSIRRHSVIMSRLEEFSAINHQSSVYPGEICTALGVSERLLHMCCHEQLGVGPHRYLGLRRMHFTRRALMHADPATTTVTEIAANHGFCELGQFSVQYRALFGESHSTSLRRPPDERANKNQPVGLRFSDFA
jgi:AraC-like DNA-binding protein